MTPWYDDGDTIVFHADCIEALRSMPDNSIDSIVTDPPYGLGFMGKAWDALPPGVDFAIECLRVLKPGGHMLAFGGSRTWHRLAAAIEDAGFEIRDSIAWLYGSGFPKSLDVSKAIDKAAGAEREVIGVNPRAAQQTAKPDATSYGAYSGTSPDLTAPATPQAEKWQGWGTALKPAFEPIVVGRKSLVGTVAANVLAHGTGALNIDASRIEGSEKLVRPSIDRRDNAVLGKGLGGGVQTEPAGRFPANVILDESQAAELDAQSGISKSPKPSSTARYGEHEDTGGNVILGRGLSSSTPNRAPLGDSGGASRFFYVAKAPKSERPVVDGTAHPTVKPLALMRYLIKLVTPPGGVVLDPFLGSGTTAEAAILEGFRVTGVEREESYLPLILARIARAEGVDHLTEESTK